VILARIKKPARAGFFIAVKIIFAVPSEKNQR